MGGHKPPDGGHKPPDGGHKPPDGGRKVERPGSPTSADHLASPFRRFLPLLVVVGLLLVHIVLALSSIKNKCTTFDEIAHLTKGYAFWRINDNRLMPDHPPLAQAWAALPLLDDSLRFPKLDQKAWHTSDIYKLGKQFFMVIETIPTPCCDRDA